MTNQVEARVALLERRLHRQRLFLAAMGLGLFLLLGAGFQSPQTPPATRGTATFDRIEAGEFVLVRDGEERARLGFDESNHRWPGLCVRNEAGEEQIQLLFAARPPT